MINVEPKSSQPICSLVEQGKRKRGEKLLNLLETSN